MPLAALPGPSQALEGGLARIARGRHEDDDLVPNAELGLGEPHEGPHESEGEILKREGRPMVELEEGSAVLECHGRGLPPWKALRLRGERGAQGCGLESREKGPQHKIGQLRVGQGSSGESRGIEARQGDWNIEPPVRGDAIEKRPLRRDTAPRRISCFYTRLPPRLSL